MPRFGLKSLLIGVTLVALWFSTLSGYTGADDVRAFIMTAIRSRPVWPLTATPRGDGRSGWDFSERC